MMCSLVVLGSIAINYPWGNTVLYFSLVGNLSKFKLVLGIDTLAAPKKLLFTWGGITAL